MNPIEFVWGGAGAIFGCALGFLFVGYLIKPAIQRWEGSESMQRMFFSIAVFLVGSGGGTAIMAAFSRATPWYLGGVGVGILWGCFHKPRLLPSLTLEGVTSVVRLSEALRDRIPSVDERSAAILALLAPPTSKTKSQQEIGAALDAALDKVAKK